jgi:hypothetical protein
MEVETAGRGEPVEPAGWLLVGGRRELDAPAMLARYGTVFRWPVDDEDATRAQTLVPGQPCFLYLTDRSRTVGLWAVGSVVAPVLSLAAGAPLLAGEAVLEPVPDSAQARRWAEVELLAVERPIARDLLLENQVLARSHLRDASAPALVPLRSAEVRALESFDFWLVEPDPHQRAQLEDLLAAEDELMG